MKKLAIVKPYQAFYKKRLQTQSFLQTDLNSNMDDLAEKIMNSLKTANKESSAGQQKLHQVKTRLKTKEREQTLSRQSLRSKIQNRMKLSQVNLAKIKSDKKTVKSSRNQFQSKIMKNIKQKEKKQLEQSLIRSKQYQNRTQTFFKEEEKKKNQQYRRLQKIQPTQRYQRINDSNVSFERSVSRRSSSVSKRPQVPVLKINDQILKQRQLKKEKLQTDKQTWYLKECMKKMQSIDKIKTRFNSVPRKTPQSTLPKVISQERDVQIRTSRAAPTRMTHKPTFSEIYDRKLSEKRHKKQEYHSLVLNEGDKILAKEHRQSLKVKEQKLIKESVNQFNRWSNYMFRQG